MNIRDMFQEFVNKSYDELKQTAKLEITQIIQELSKYIEKKHVYDFLIITISSCIGADGVLSVKEKQFLQDVMGIDPGKARNFIEKTHNYEYADSIIDNCGAEIKSKFLVLCLCVCAVDEKITAEEIALLERFIR